MGLGRHARVRRRALASATLTLALLGLAVGCGGAAPTGTAPTPVGATPTAEPVPDPASSSVPDSASLAVPLEVPRRPEPADLAARVVAGTTIARLPAPAEPSPTGRSSQAQAAERAAAATTTADGNPLAGRRWGTYLGPSEHVSAPYNASTGETRAVLAHLALAPKATWFGHWIPDGEIEARTRAYVEATQAGDPETLVQLSMFRAVPWEAEACRRLPTAAEQESYRRWTDAFARGIGEAHAAVVLQPDGPFALCTPGGVGVQTALVKYAAERLSAQPNTSVYIEVGAADWPAPGQGGVDEVLRFLLPSGIESARGVALNGTHYSATEAEVLRGAEIVRALAARGIPDKHFVVNTSSNGRPFKYGEYRGSGRWAHPDNARPCASPSDPGTCVALGIPPTSDVANPRWGLSAEASALAASYADGYLWFGRPWLYFQNSPFEMDKALAVIRSSPYWS